MMTLEEFKENVDLYSADLSRWPVDKAKPALALVNAQAEAKDYFDAMRAVEDELRAYDPLPQNTGSLESRIMAAVMADPTQEAGRTEEAADTAFSTHLAAAQLAGGKSGMKNAGGAEKRSGFKWKPAYIFAPGGGLLAAAILGFIIGVMPQSRSTDYLVDPVYYAQDQIISGDTDLYSGGLF